MKTVSVLLAILPPLLLTTAVRVQGDALPQAERQGASAAQTELAEAERLNTTVVKLFGDRKYNDALPIAKRVLEIRERTLAAEDQRVLEALTNLAEIYVARGNYRDAQALFEKALKTLEKKSGPDSPSVAKLLDRLAFTNYVNGDPSRTESLFKRALAIREKSFGLDHEEVAHSLYLLADFYQFDGDYKKAEPLYQRLVEIRNKNSNRRPAALAEALESYACLLHKVKRQDEAVQLEVRAYDVTHPGEDLLSRLVNGGIVNGKAVSLPRPQYPKDARASRVSGKVTVRVLIDESGTVIRACAIEGPNLLMKASESAAYRSRFSPTMVGSQPVRVHGVIEYKFFVQ